MECKHVDDLMMKYMDKTLIKNEAELLKKHISECDKCLSDFSLYDEMMSCFGESELYEAPPGFEEAVINKLIADEGFSYKKISANAESFMLAALGIISVIVATVFLLIVNRVQILDFMAGYPSLEGLVAVLRPLSVLAEQFFANVVESAAALASSASAFILQYRFAFLGMFAVVAGGWFAVLKLRGRKAID